MKEFGFAISVISGFMMMACHLAGIQSGAILTVVEGFVR